MQKLSLIPVFIAVGAGAAAADTTTTTTTTTTAATAAAPAPMPAPAPAPTVMMQLPQQAPERTLSINVDPFGLLQGYYGGNVEWLHGAHGVVVAADYWQASNDASSTNGGGAYVGYRWHWRGRQNSGFLGVMVGGGYGGGNATVTNTAGQTMTYDLTVQTLEVTANIGKRWQLDNGLNITFRIGGGWASRSVTTTSSDADAQKAASDLQDALAWLPIALDGELSLGYSF